MLHKPSPGGRTTEGRRAADRVCSAVRRRTPCGPVPVLWTVALGLWGSPGRTACGATRPPPGRWPGGPPPTSCSMLEHVDVVHGLYYLLMHGLFACSRPRHHHPAPAVRARRRRGGGLRGRPRPHRLAGAWPASAEVSCSACSRPSSSTSRKDAPYALVAAGAGLATLLLVDALQGRGSPALLGGLRRRGRRVRPAQLALAAGPAGASRDAAVGAPERRVLLRLGRGLGGRRDRVLPLVHVQPRPVRPGVLDTAADVAHDDRPRRPAGDRRARGPGRPPAPGQAVRGVRRPAAARGAADRSHRPVPGQAAVRGPARPVQPAGPGPADRRGPRRAGTRGCAPRHRAAAPWLVPVLVAAAALALLPQSLAKRSPASRVDDVSP